MRIAILSDVHGNLEALESVLVATHRESVDRLVGLGDANERLITAPPAVGSAGGAEQIVLLEGGTYKHYESMDSHQAFQKSWIQITRGSLNLGY